MGDSGTLFSPSALLCNEDEVFLSEEYLGEAKTCMDLEYLCFVSENEDEYIKHLVQRESAIGFGSKSCVSSLCDCSSTSQSWLKDARLDAIEWIFNTRAIFGFQFLTAYVCVTYFDRFLSKRYIDDEKVWTIRLLSVACLSLAAKMEECKAPALSEYRMEEINFENKMIKKMELLVMKTLDWKLGSITPFAFLYYFINKFCGESRPKALVSRAVELIVAITREINLMDHRPSAIAAAAVLVAIDDQFTKKELELKMSVISLWGSLENEHVFSCYNIMQNIEMGKVKTPKSVVSPNLSSMNSSSIDVIENSSSTIAAGTKRRLTFTNSDRTCPVKRSHRA
ncbi:cyclin-D5-1-like [Corylus avellana]|uniref:cyclin-D5-1-like n=1 Tax=Corylus avellana TaxID=13451 RepID=UPI00286CB10A|nr:cyclin-D5-1-like [Corylus avellana]